MAVSSVTSNAGTAALQSSSTATDPSERFLKLLVAQMQNQDPLNPMDNAQVTSQMAQIQTVTGIDKLNTTVAGLNSQFVQMQALQSISLVGREVSVPGNKMQVTGAVAEGSYELDEAAKTVKLEILGPGGNVIDTQQLGAQGSGRQTFTWKAGTMAGEGSEVKYRITAANGTKAVNATLYVSDKVDAVYSEGGALKLNLQRLGPVDYTAVSAVN